jgi:anion-transporting  ArsA/GET3 family ATPase
LLRREAERAWELFTDRSRSGVIVVTLPEEMPVSESVELHEALTKELGLPVVGIAVNGMIEQLFDSNESEWLERVAQETPEQDLAFNLLRAGRRRTLRERVQAESLSRIASHFSLPRYQLPQLMVPELRRAGMEQLSRAFSD